MTQNKITDHSHDKYITTPEFNELTAENLVTKTDFDDELINLNKKNNLNKTKYLT